MNRMIFGVAVGLLVATGSEAQVVDEVDRVRQRNDCRLAVQVLETGHPHPHWTWAMDVVDRCTEYGGAALARTWAVPPADITALTQLVLSSQRLRDQRIVDAVLEVARSESASREVRLRALQVLASYVDPSRTPRLDEMERSDDPYQFPSIRRNMHVVTFEGSRPPAPDTPLRVLGALRTLGETAGDQHVREAAAFLHEALRTLVDQR